MKAWSAYLLCSR